jgi:hypothetical protein
MESKQFEILRKERDLTNLTDKYNTDTIKLNFDKKILNRRIHLFDSTNQRLTATIKNLQTQIGNLQNVSRMERDRLTQKLNSAVNELNTNKTFIDQNVRPTGDVDFSKYIVYVLGSDEGGEAQIWQVIDYLKSVGIRPANDRTLVILLRGADKSIIKVSYYSKTSEQVAKKVSEYLRQNFSNSIRTTMEQNDNKSKNTIDINLPTELQTIK